MTCTATADMCVCTLPEHGPETPHLCDCEGSWSGEYDADSFTIVSPPRKYIIPVADLAYMKSLSWTDEQIEAVRIEGQRRTDALLLELGY